MTTEELAAQIYVRVVSDRIMCVPKVWILEPKEAAKIARACLEAAEAFMAQSAKAQELGEPKD